MYLENSRVPYSIRGAGRRVTAGLTRAGQLYSLLGLRPAEFAMQYWLFKSEPSNWSWQQQLDRGDKGEEWDGVRNYQARNFMRTMEIGDRGFFYHSQKDKAIVGLVEVIATAHPDSTTDDPRWECVDIKAVASLPTPVTLEVCKLDPRLADMVLVNNPRLSVQPVTAEEYAVICELGGHLGK
jgi:predicted RNA-binding protein with PUA-like domain